MSSVEKSYETVEKSYWYCPSCGASSEKSLPATPEMVSDGTVTCAACGKIFQESDVSIGNYDNASKIGHPSRGGNRNPLALVVVAVVAAAMLYFGFHMARRSAPPPPISKIIPRAGFHLGIARREKRAAVGPARQSGATEFLGYLVRTLQD